MMYMLCITSINLMMFCLPQRKPFTKSAMPHSCPLATPDLCLSFPLLDDSYRWNVTVGTFLPCSHIFGI